MPGGPLHARAILKDPQTLEDDGSNNLRVKVASGGGLERSASGLQLSLSETAAGGQSGTYAVNFSRTNPVVTITASGDLTISEGTGWPSSGTSGDMQIVLDNSGDHTVTLSIADYDNGASIGAGVYIIGLMCRGGSIYATIAGPYS